MTDTVAVALIAVGGTLTSGGLSYLSARGKTKVELKSISSEMVRFEAERSETGKESRKVLYRELISVVGEFQAHARHLQRDSDIDAVLIRFYERMSEMQLLGPEPVVAKTEELRGVVIGFIEAQAEMQDQDPEMQAVEVNRAAIASVSDRLKAARVALLTAMREDLATNP